MTSPALVAKAGVVAGYLGFAAWITYAVVRSPVQGEPQPGWLVAVLLLVHGVAGLALGRWAFALPAGWVLLALPAGPMRLPDIDPPIWLWALVFAPVWAAAVAAGAGLRWLALRPGRGAP